MQDEAQRSAAGDGGSTATTAPAPEPTDETGPAPAVDDAAPGPSGGADAGVGAPAGPGDAPVYGAYYYDRLIGDYEQSGRYEYTGEWREFFRVMAHHIATRFNPKRTLDAGCAKGFLVRALREHPIEAFGIDASEYAISEADQSIKDYVRVGSITEPLDGPYDLITCIEVIEHLPDSEIENAITRLCEASDRILFSSTPDDFVEPSHLSVKAPEDWVALFAKRGFYRNFNVDTSFVTPWAVLFERLPAGDASQAIREYDRHVQRQKREIDELRAAVIKFSADLDGVYGEVAPEMHELATAKLDLETQLATLHALHDELQEQHREVALERDGLRTQLGVDHLELLRLRDLLIGKERELGGVIGRITELESELRQFGRLPEQYREVVESTTWKLAWKILAPYRKLRTVQGNRAGSDG